MSAADDAGHHVLSPATVRFCPLCGGAVARRPVPPDHREHAVCAGCDFVFYLNPKVVAATIPEDDGRVLLTRRAINPARGKWTFPGGFVDLGESTMDAALRETLEETGLRVRLTGLVGVYSYPDSPVIVVYRARVVDGAITLCNENDAVEWVEPGAIPWTDLAFPSTHAALTAWLKRKRVRARR